MAETNPTAKEYAEAFSPLTNTKSPNQSRIREILDINDDNKIDWKDIAIMAAIGLVFYPVYRFVFKNLSK